MTTLQEVFTKHFPRDDLKGAKKWFRKWAHEDNQHIPELVETHGPGAQFSLRAMAGHISDYLEGYTGQEPESYNGSDSTDVGLSGKNYNETKYGSEIYFSA